MSTSPAQRFKSNIKGLTSLLIDTIKVCSENNYSIISPYMLQAASAIMELYDDDLIINTFINSSYRGWSSVLRKDPNYFLENSKNIFGNLPVNVGECIDKLINAPCTIVPTDDKNLIWEYFHSLVKISIRHIHEQRKKDSQSFKEIDIDSISREWKVALQ